MPIGDSAFSADAAELLTFVLTAWANSPGLSTPQTYSGGVWNGSADFTVRAAPAAAAAYLYANTKTKDHQTFLWARDTVDYVLATYTQPNGSWGLTSGGDNVVTTIEFGRTLAIVYLQLGDALDSTRKGTWSTALANALDYLNAANALTTWRNGSTRVGLCLVAYLAWLATGQSRMKTYFDIAFAFALAATPVSTWPGYGLRSMVESKLPDGSDGQGFFTSVGIQTGTIPFNPGLVEPNPSDGAPNTDFWTIPLEGNAAGTNIVVASERYVFGTSFGGTQQYASMYWKEGFLNNGMILCTIEVAPVDFYFYSRFRNPNGSTQNTYGVQWTPAAGGTVQFFEETNSVVTNLGAAVTGIGGTPTPGLTRFGHRVVSANFSTNPVLEFWVDIGDGLGLSLRASFTDTLNRHATSGYVGVMAKAGTQLSHVKAGDAGIGLDWVDLLYQADLLTVLYQFSNDSRVLRALSMVTNLLLTRVDTASQWSLDTRLGVISQGQGTVPFVTPAIVALALRAQRTDMQALAMPQYVAPQGVEGTMLYYRSHVSDVHYRKLGDTVGQILMFGAQADAAAAAAVQAAQAEPPPTPGAAGVIPLDDTQPSYVDQIALFDQQAALTENDLVVTTDPLPPLGRSWAIDFQLGQFVTGEGHHAGPLEIHGDDTLKQWIAKCLMTTRGASPIYPSWYGLQGDFGLGGPVEEPPGDLEARIADALKQHPYIADVLNFAWGTPGPTDEFWTLSFDVIREGGDTLSVTGLRVLV